LAREELLPRKNCEVDTEPVRKLLLSRQASGKSEGMSRASAADMELDITRVHDIVVLEFRFEELDAGNSSEFKRDVALALDAHPKVVFDLSRLRFIDSSGLGAFLSCLRRVTAHGGELKLCGLSKGVRAVFELVRMHRVFDIHPTREAAVRAFTSIPETARAPA
jgi:anti-sigma B factor antagonist